MKHQCLAAMPYKRRRNYRRRRSKRKPYFRRRSGRTLTRYPRYRRVGIKNIDNFLPSKLCVKLKYADDIQTVAAVIGSIVMRGNSAFDPDWSFGGHQPMGYDQITPFYNRYYVTSSAIEVIPYAVTGASSLAPIVTLYAGTSTSSLSQISDLLEQPGVRTLQLSDMNNTAREGVHAFAIRAKASTYKMLGVKPSSDEDAQALVTSNPNKMWFWHINHANATATNFAMRIRVRMWLTIVFINKKTLTGS